MDTNLENLMNLHSKSENTKDVVLKEILHYEILTSLSNSDISNEIVFQGGTALRLCYGSNRYSEDLNFVLRDKNLKFDSNLLKEFEIIFANLVKIKYNLETELIYPKNEESLVQKWTAKIFIPFQNRKSKINIEICKLPSYDNSIKELHNYYDKFNDIKILLRVENLTEILADKIVAFGAREYMKFRDLWDIKWLYDYNVKLDIDLINKKIKDYKIENFNEKLGKKLLEIDTKNASIGFEQEMKRFLKKDFVDKIIKLSFFDDVKKAVKIKCVEFKNNGIQKIKQSRIKDEKD